MEKKLNLQEKEIVNLYKNKIKIKDISTIYNCCDATIYNLLKRNNIQVRPDKPQPQLCECGCEDYAKPGKRFISGHNSKGENNPNRGKKWTLEQKIISSCKKRGIPIKEFEGFFKICDQCGNDFKYQNKDQRFCSQDCQNEWQKTQTGELSGGWKGGKVISICLNCGNLVEDYPSQKREYVFCNEKCYLNYIKNNRIGGKSAGYTFSEETKENLRGSRPSITGDKNPNWKGGISNSSYCYKFNESLKDAHRRYFNYLCFMDNELEENGNKLSDHHVGYDKRCGCDATQFCIFVPVKAKWNIKFNGSKEHNRWYWYTLLMIKIFIEHPNYFAYHIPVWGMNELEYNYSYVFEKFRRK